MYYFKDLSGQTFGKITVVSRCENRELPSGSFVQWNCYCQCNPDKIIKITSDSLRQGKTHCGCAKIKRINDKARTHGMSNTRLFRIWSSMQQRCYNKNHVGYSRYGGRGISICPEWLGKKGFQAFYDWAILAGYTDDLSIDRINNNLGYFPANCEWSTAAEQQRNRNDNIVITINGEEKTLIDWCRIKNADYALVRWRMNHGYPQDRLFEPPREWKSEKTSGVKGVIWQKHKIGGHWVVKGLKNGKPDRYIAEFKELEDALKFKEQYDSTQIKITEE